MQECHGQLFLQTVKHMHEKILKWSMQSAKKYLCSFVKKHNIKVPFGFLRWGLHHYSLVFAFHFVFACATISILQREIGNFFVSKMVDLQKTCPRLFPLKRFGYSAIKNYSERTECKTWRSFMQRRCRLRSCCFRWRKKYNQNALQNL